MPDRYGETDWTDVPPAPDPEAPLIHLEAWAIVECGMCDDDGYRGVRICDHVDRSEVVARGMAKVRKALAKEAS